MQNVRNSLLKALVSKIRNIPSNVSQTVCRGRFTGVLWCAAILFKVLYTDTNFLPKCCHKVMVDNAISVIVIVYRPLPRDGGMVENYGASEAGQLRLS